MGIWTLTGTLTGSAAAVMVDSVTLTTFGPVLRDAADVESFIRYLAGLGISPRDAEKPYDLLVKFREMVCVSDALLGSEWCGKLRDLEIFCDVLSEQLGREVVAVGNGYERARDVHPGELHEAMDTHAQDNPHAWT